MVTVPPLAGTQTRSVAPPPVCSRKFRAGALTATMRRPSREYTGWVNDAGLLVRRLGEPPPAVLTTYKCPPSALLHVVYVTACPSGLHAGWYSTTSMCVRRFGVPLGQSMTYSRSSATNASCRPLGDGTASRICLTTNVAESVIGYWKCTAGPNACTTSASIGISTGLPSSTGTFHS